MNIAEAYNHWSIQYDTNENKTRDLDQKATIEMLSKFDFNNVLELGCGTGKNTLWLKNKASRVIGLDFSEKMLTIAKQKIQDDKVSFIKADLTTPWQVEDNFADLITCSLTLEHIEDLNFIFQQANKKLSPKGYFFISELHPFKQYLGSKARYETTEGLTELETYIHHFSEYLEKAKNNHFDLIELKEQFDNTKELHIPRLICLVFQKSLII